MSGYPLAALHINPPADPIEGVKNAMALKGMMLNQQAQQQEQEIRAQQIKDQKAMTAAMQQWDGKNLDDLAGLTVKNGASAGAVLKLKEGVLAQKKTYSDIAKNDAETGAKNLDTLKQKTDLALGAIDAAKQVPDEQLADHLATTIQGLAQNGTIDQQHAQAGAQLVQALKGGQIDVPTARQQLDLYEKGLQGRSSLIADAEKQSITRKNTAEVTKLETETAALKAAGGLTPQQQEARYASILQKAASGQAISPEERFFARGYEAANKKTTTSADSLGVTSTNTSGPSGLASVGAGSAPGVPVRPMGGAPARGGAAQPQNLKDSLVDAIGQYKYNPTLLSRLSTKHPEILAAVAQKYPDWSQSNYNAINKAVTDLAPSGKTGQQITSYNTFLRHAGALYDAVDSLDNSKYSDLLNKPLNWLAQHTGDARVADFMAAMQPPMKEFQSFLLNNHAMHEEDVKDAHSLIDVNKTPQEIRAVLKRFAETGSARLSEQNESFKRVTGRDIPNLVSPEAAKAYNKITGEGGTKGGTKTLSMAQIQQAAKDHGVSIDEAKRQAIAAGYQIK